MKLLTHAAGLAYVSHMSHCNSHRSTTANRTHPALGDLLPISVAAGYGLALLSLVLVLLITHGGAG
jgi:hypothetical protein